MEWHRPKPMADVKYVTVKATDDSVKMAADSRIEAITRHLTAHRREPSGWHSRTPLRESKMGVMTSAEIWR